MPLVEVYNTTNSPVIYGDGKTIAGLEWVTVEEDEVRQHIDNGTLIFRRNRNQVLAAAEQELAVEIPAEDSSEPETVVPSNTADETTPGEESETVVELPVDTAATKAKPDTMRKTRRRKTTTPVKE